jgi:membrane peptidoglycan carboxypeptidase
MLIIVTPVLTKGQLKYRDCDSARVGYNGLVKLKALWLSLRRQTDLRTLPKRWRRWSRRQRIMAVASAAAGLAVVTCIIIFILFLRDLPSPTKLNSTEKLAVSSQILDRNGNVLYEIFADENRTPIALKDLPKYVSEATIAIEDKNFYHHFGIDIAGVARAAINTLFHRKLQGGSTLTQQLIKVSLLTRERTIDRKIKEAVLTLATELLYAKDQILEMYLNHIPCGSANYF